MKGYISRYVYRGARRASSSKLAHQSLLVLLAGAL